MGYIGNQQTEGYSQVPPKQDFTGATGTTLTLSNAVASAEGIDLFINNVRQEPTTAYSVGADGVTVTLTGSVVATDDIYVVYNSLARQTSTHPSNQALQATSGSFSGNLTVDTNTLYVDSTNNRVGIRTTSPFSTLSALVGTNAPSTSGNMSSHGVTIHNGTGGRAIQMGVNESGAYNYIQSSYVNNANVGVNLAFFTGASERMRIDSSGNLLVGTTSPDPVATNVKGIVLEGPQGSAKFSRENVACLDINRKTSDGEVVRIYKNGSKVGNISVTGSSTSYNTSSDYRLKENVTATWDATTRLKQLNPVRFNFIADADITVDGFLAHEVQDVVPEAISGTKDAMMDEEYEVTPAVLDEDGNEVTPAVMGTRSVPEYQGIDQSKLVPLLVKTIQELEARIVALEAN